MKKKPVCEECEYWVYTHVGLLENKIWHCRDGFNPHNNKWGCCKDDCKMNDKFKEQKK